VRITLAEQEETIERLWARVIGKDQETGAPQMTKTKGRDVDVKRRGLTLRSISDKARSQVQGFLLKKNCQKMVGKREKGRTCLRGW